MNVIRHAEERGLANLGWLNSRHTFSFGHYYDPRHMGFGPLRVINEDRVQPGKGFDTHGHSDMEIISWVLDGALEVHQAPAGLLEGLRPHRAELLAVLHGMTFGAIADGSTTARAVTEAHLQRIEAHESAVHAFNEVMADRALELVRRHLPWVRRIYVLTRRPQVPECLQPGEVVVFHEAVGLRGHTFNSHAIEASLHMLPGLSEHFLYLNDDFYVKRPCSRRRFPFRLRR